VRLVLFFGDVGLHSVDLALMLLLKKIFLGHRPIDGIRKNQWCSFRDLSKTVDGKRTGGENSNGRWSEQFPSSFCGSNFHLLAIALGAKKIHVP
jgi:hypothetical protein